MGCTGLGWREGEAWVGLVVWGRSVELVTVLGGSIAPGEKLSPAAVAVAAAYEVSQFYRKNKT